MKLKAQRKAKEMRKQGISMVKIAKELNVSKSSVYRWCQDIKLTNEQKSKLQENKSKAMKKARKKAMERKSEIKEKRIKENRKKGKQRVGKLSERDKYIAGLMLYSGEGAKTDGRVEIANTNPQIIKFMLDWFNYFFNKKPSDFRAELYIHDNLDSQKAIDFWHKYTKIPIEKFLEPYIVKNNKNRIHKNIHEYGVLKIGFCSCKIHREIMGSIEKILTI